MLNANILFQLISSLTSSERRKFKLYVKRIKVNKNSKFILLFDLLVTMRNYNESHIFKYTTITKKQLCNIKLYLLKQLLISLRFNTNLDIGFKIRELFDFSYILYSKGFFKEAIIYLNKATCMAMKNGLFSFLIKIIHFKRRIENLFIYKINYYNNDYNYIINNLYQENILINIYTYINIYFCNKGHILYEKDKKFINNFFLNKISAFNLYQLNIYQKILYYQSLYLYYYVINNFIMTYIILCKFIRLLQFYPIIKNDMIFHFLKSYFYLLNVLFYLNKYTDFLYILNTFNSVCININVNINVTNEFSCLIFLYKNINIINIHFMKGTYSRAINYLYKMQILNVLKNFYLYLDMELITIFYYKIACLYFNVGNYIESIKYFIQVIKYKKYKCIKRKDIQCFSRILYLFACYECGLDSNFFNKIKSVYNYFIKENYLGDIQKIILKYFFIINTCYPYQFKCKLKELKNILYDYKKDPFIKIFFLDVDIILWITSRITNISLENLKQHNFIKY